MIFIELKNILDFKNKEEFRIWLENNHKTETECWVYCKRGKIKNDENFYYIDAVYVALCFGWIDSTIKKVDGRTIQRFSPRKKDSHWTELNKERCRWLIKKDLMTTAGLEILPDLDKELEIDPIIQKALESDEEILKNFNNFPKLYQKIRIGNIMRDIKFNRDYEKSLARFLEKTKKNIIYGDWNDNGRLLE